MSPAPQTSAPSRRPGGPTLVALAALLAALATTWPLVLDPAGAVLGDPTIEAVDHLWALWAGSRDGPLVIHTQLLRYPDGYAWVLGDPLDLLWFWPGLVLGGPVLGFNLVQLTNVLLAGLAGVVAGRVFLGDEAGPAALTAAVAATSATLAGGMFTGMTEAQTMGWVVLALAALDRALVAGGPARALLAGALLAACAWAGPYAGLYAALLAPLLVLTRAGRPRVFARAAAAAALGLAGALPVLLAIRSRAAGLPGTEALARTMLQDPELGKNRMMGADLLGLVLPLEPATGASQHTVYLGLAALLLAGLALLRWRRGAGRPWPLVALVLACAVLSLGLYLQVGGVVVRLGARILLLPAGVLSLAVEAIGQAPRWYRAAMPAAILLAPLASAGAAVLTGRLPARARSVALVVLGLVVAADNLLLAPVPWPRTTFPATPPAGYALLSDPGPIVEVPPVRFASDLPSAQRRGGDTAGPDDATYEVADALPIRHVALLWQTFHGRPMGGNPHQAEDKADRTEASLAAERLDRAVRSPAKGSPDAPNKVRLARETLRTLGFAWIVHHPVPSLPERTEAYRRALGPPAVDTPELLAWRPSATAGLPRVRTPTRPVPDEPGPARGRPQAARRGGHGHRFGHLRSGSGSARQTPRRGTRPQGARRGAR